MTGARPVHKVELHSVLHVPKLTYNLVSIIKLTKDLNCVAQFYNFNYQITRVGSGLVGMG